MFGQTAGRDNDREIASQAIRSRPRKPHRPCRHTADTARRFDAPSETAYYRRLLTSVSLCGRGDSHPLVSY